MKRTVIINRAVPGSGKTTITKCIIKELEKHKIKVALHSTDEYFMNEGRYEFDTKKLELYHKQNLDDFKASLEKGCDVAICDNTNLAPWQSEPYTNLARKHGYQIIFITLDPRELEKHVEAQKITDEKPDAHGVSQEVLKDMIAEYELYDALLDKNASIDPRQHLDYKWDKLACKKQPTDELAKHFDSDYVIRILPSEYRQMQDSIGKKVLSYIKIKALITILGTAGYDVKHMQLRNSMPEYIEGDVSVGNFRNLFPFLYEKYSKNYEIIAFYTQEAKIANTAILKDHKISDDEIEKVFKNGVCIEKIEDYDKIFADMNSKINDKKYEKIIIDVSHGFRHLPILMIIDSVIANFDERDRIEKIIFTKQIEENERYEIIDLRKYLDIANLAFILTAFKDNYTVITHVKVAGFPKLLSALNGFSDNIMSLNLKKLFKESLPNLKNALENIINAPETMSVRVPAKELLSEINEFKEDEEFKQYYLLATKFYNKKYFLPVLALLFEGVRSYAVLKMSKNDKVLKIIKNLRENSKKKDDYQIRDMCMKAVSPTTNPKKASIINKDLKAKLGANMVLFTKAAKGAVDEQLYSFYSELGEARNNLAHANSGKEIERSRDKITSFLARYKNLVIDRNV